MWAAFLWSSHRECCWGRFITVQCLPWVVLTSTTPAILRNLHCFLSVLVLAFSSHACFNLDSLRDLIIYQLVFRQARSVVLHLSRSLLAHVSREEGLKVSVSFTQVQVQKHRDLSAVYKKKTFFEGLTTHDSRPHLQMDPSVEQLWTSAKPDTMATGSHQYRCQDPWRR